MRLLIHGYDMLAYIVHAANGAKLGSIKGGLMAQLLLQGLNCCITPVCCKYCLRVEIGSPESYETGESVFTNLKCVFVNSMVSICVHCH
jgi:hypothetical protein